jgi:hypothetical protein
VKRERDDPGVPSAVLAAYRAAQSRGGPVAPARSSENGSRLGMTCEATLMPAAKLHVFMNVTGLDSQALTSAWSAL